MGKISCLEEAVLSIVREFTDGLEEMDPFELHLSEFRMRLRAKLLQIYTSLQTERKIAEMTMASVVESLGRVLVELVGRADMSSERKLYRTIRTVETVRELLRDLAYTEVFTDRRAFLSVNGVISELLEGFRIRGVKTLDGKFLS